jgi:lipid II:glycine glycyltransferase (peptidoglycan interpeptide bridge formation enzyme)
MTNAITVERLPKQKWDALAPIFRDASYRQGSSYAAAAARCVGATSELNGLLENRSLIGLADVRVKAVPLTSLGIAYANYAPVSARDDGFSTEQFGLCLDALRQEYVERRRFVLRIVPTLNGGLFQQLQIACLESHGFRLCTQQKARETFLLDLAKPLAAIRSGFDPKWRSDLAKAERAGIIITKSVELDDFDRFETILGDLAKQKGFVPSQDVSFFRQVQTDTPQDQKFILHLAWHESELVAGHLGSFVGDTAVYLLGAANSKGRDLRASYLLQWAAIEHAKNVGNIFYDLGGIDQQRNPDVYRFKRRLNGRLVTEVGPYELGPDMFRKRLFQALEAARGVLRSRSGNQ